MSSIYIYDALRTPRGKGKSTGSLYSASPLDLLVHVLRATQTRNHLSTSSIGEVAVGCVTQAKEQGACIARTAILEAGYDISVPGVTLNRFCGSGLEAIHDVAGKIAAGFCDLAIGGGVESMSRVPMGSDGGAFLDPRMALGHGLVPQGISADLLATVYGITREDVDQYALESQRRASIAQSEGLLNQSIVPVYDHSGHLLLDRDEHPRPEATFEALNALKPSFAMMGEQFKLDALTRQRYPHIEYINHIHTAGNSSGIVDGAATVLLGSAEAGKAQDLTPRARLRAAVSIGDEPVIMLTGPVPAAKAALKQAKMELSDIDLFEVNEAFAAVPLYFMNELGVSHDQVNVHGGAIAFGHPLGATGAMLLGTALDALEARDLTCALITLCIGGGMGIATIIERI